MPSYRMYRLDGAGRIAGADWVEASDDDRARAIARSQAEGSGFELWERERLVIRVGRAGIVSDPPPSKRPRP